MRPQQTDSTGLDRASGLCLSTPHPPTPHVASQRFLFLTFETVWQTHLCRPQMEGRRALGSSRPRSRSAKSPHGR